MRARPEDVAGLVAAVFETAGALRRLGDAEASTAGLTQARWQVLSVVADGDWTVPRAARRLGVRRQSVQRVVDALVHHGLLRLEHNPDHIRSPLVRPTDRGRAVLHEITVVADLWHAAVAAGLTSTAVDTTRATLERLLDAARSGAPGRAADG